MPSIRVKTSEAPTVPKASPPSSADLVRRSPKVAPKGRVRMKAIQKSRIDEREVR